MLAQTTLWCNSIWVLTVTTHCNCTQSNHAYPPTTSLHLCTAKLQVHKLLMINSGCYDLPEMPELFGQGFTSVYCCYAGQSKVLQLWEMSKSCPLQNRKHRQKHLERCSNTHNLYGKTLQMPSCLAQEKQVKK